MPETNHYDSYRNALNMAMAELNQLSEQIEMLHLRKDMLQVATDSLKPLLAVAERRAQTEEHFNNDQRPPSGPAEPVNRVAEFPAAQELASSEPRTVTRFQQVMSDITDPLQLRIQSALTSPSFA